MLNIYSGRDQPCLGKLFRKNTLAYFASQFYFLKFYNIDTKAQNFLQP
jgi:hypothetical protein